VDHSTLNRRVLVYDPLIERRLRAFGKPQWVGAYRRDQHQDQRRVALPVPHRAIDKRGEPVDFLGPARRDLVAAKRFFHKMLEDQPLSAPDRIGSDRIGSDRIGSDRDGRSRFFAPAIAATRKAGLLPPIPVHYITEHLHERIESDHFRVTKNMPASAAFNSYTARRTTAAE
jgi:transposase-like protein